jgi:hypothetical protein
VAVSWSPSTYDVATLQIDNSLGNAAIVYGISRGLNAVISILQSTEVSVVVATVTIGEILDPLNDLIERFSDLMTVALGSLALQKLFVELTSTLLFNILITVSGAVALLTLKYQTVWHRSALGLFAATVFIRLSLTAVVLINGAFDQYLINKFQTKELQQLQATKQILDKAESSTAMFSAELESITNQYTSLSKQIELLRADESAKRQTLESLKRTAPTCPIIKSTLGKCTLAELDGSAQIERAEEALKATEASRKAFEKNLEKISERRSCINKKINGESCGIWDTIKGSLPDLNLKQTIQEAKENSEAAIMAFMNLMAIFILKTIVSPLLFWWLFFVGIKAIYRQVSMTK